MSHWVDIGGTGRIVYEKYRTSWVLICAKFNRNPFTDVHGKMLIWVQWHFLNDRRIRCAATNKE